MDISPQRVRTAEFKTVKKGLDPDEVRQFLDEVAVELERAQNQSTAMEARARAAVARLQEISDSTPAPDSEQQVAETTAHAVAAEPAPAPAEVSASIDQSETISRTLLLAQRTADTTIAEAEAEAAAVRTAAEEEATRTLDSTREMSGRLIDEARDEARRSGDAERIQVESEVNALLARRDFLESDVDHMQTFLADERSRLRGAASSILDIVERVGDGLGDVRRPLLSASDDEAPADLAGADLAGAERDEEEPAASSTSELAATAEVTVVSTVEEVDAEPDDDEPDQLVIQTDISDEGPTGFSYDANR